MMSGKCPLWVEKLDPQAVARKLDEMDEMQEVIAKWKGEKPARKTDAECRKTTWNPPTENHSHPKVPCWERTVRQGVFIWHGGGEEENGDQGNW